MEISQSQGIPLPNSQAVEDLCKEWRRANPLTFPEAIQQVGLENMCTIYDIAQLRRALLQLGGERAFVRLAQLAIDTGQELANASLRDERPDWPLYMWTNQFLGLAPAGHPVEGRPIIARIEGWDERKQTENCHLDRLFGRSNEGRIIVSNEHFAILDGLKFTVDQGVYAQCGHIIGFEEKNGFMCPITSGPCNSEDVRLFGTIGFWLNAIRPVCCRPCSWSSHIEFHSNDSADHPFSVLERKKILEALARLG